MNYLNPNIQAQAYSNIHQTMSAESDLLLSFDEIYASKIDESVTIHINPKNKKEVEPLLTKYKDSWYINGMIINFSENVPEGKMLIEERNGDRGTYNKK